MSMALSNMLRGQIFLKRNATLLSVSTGSILVYFFGRMAFEGLANNMVASDLGIEHWWEPGVSTPLSEYTPALLLAYALSVAAFAIKRGTKLQEDVDGLV